MAPVSLCDELDLSVAECGGVQIDCDTPGIPTGPENLIAQAAAVFSEAIGKKVNLQVTLRKRIPHGAGLGGGSSDAAATLRGVNVLCGSPLSNDELVCLAAAIGSDVPFFIAEKPAWCRGRGERMQSTNLSNPLQLLLIKPPFPVATADAYMGWTSNVQPIESLLRGIPLRNDLEEPVFKKHLLLPVMKSWLLAQPEVEAALMTGSGSTLFAVLRTPGTTLPQRIREEFGETIWTHPCETRL